MADPEVLGGLAALGASIATFYAVSGGCYQFLRRVRPTLDEPNPTASLKEYRMQLREASPVTYWLTWPHEKVAEGLSYFLK